MFTGIVEELGSVVKLDMPGEGANDAAASARLTVRGPLVASDATHGASISVNGVCVTVVDVDAATFTVDVMPETLDRSALGRLRPDDPLNLERAVKASDRLGGHIVQGHVDGVGAVHHRTPGERWDVVRIGLPADISRYVVEKGSIAVDGVSLTVSGLGPDWFEVSLIPTTLEATTLGHRQPGDEVNLEVDVIAKYVERLVERRGEA
ncbi:riboflavin synthase [Actinobacteria bacterium YIM 96077]|uniref:Riboflavin synthase n=1 Tax=Phytoactinopolyspora halophila TaxID=1981511 RepID=A0A329QLH6_9ACTN|nr:riboflavin synthase [Phytoactinopolyspora halophila]AYY12971.1 riboflavin synthase [Actinobacteria bacterium YIM 96077]RAW13235.1 riboflavin synthase [Phytoactinopolyspora halophila]